MQRYLDQRIGQPLDTAQLNRDQLRAFGDDLRLGLRLDSTLLQGSTYQLRAGYQKTWLNALGGELLLVGERGSELFRLAPARLLNLSA